MKSLRFAHLWISLVALSAVLVGTRSAHAQVPIPAPSFAFLTGDQEVPAVETDAIGVAVTKQFGEMGLFYFVATFGLEDITAAHIHMGAAGENGPVVAFLFDAGGDPLTQDGVLAFDLLTADDLTGPLEGEPLSALVELIGSGNAYVNVHTVANPGGEIRGQLSPLAAFSMAPPF